MTGDVDRYAHILKVLAKHGFDGEVIETSISEVAYDGDLSICFKNAACAGGWRHLLELN